MTRARSLSPSGMRRLLTLLVLALGTGVCQARDEIATAQGNAIGVDFPEEMAEFRLTRTQAFPQAGLGVSLSYLRPGPVVGTVYIYNAGLASIPSGTATPEIRQQFAQVMDEVKQLEILGKARAVIIPAGDPWPTAYSGCGPQFLWKVFQIVPDEDAYASYTYLTVHRDQFVKLRISHPLADAGSRRHVERFVQQMRGLLGGCPG